MTWDLAQVFLLVGVGIWAMMAKKLMLYLAVFFLGFAFILEGLTGFWVYGVGLVMLWALIASFKMVLDANVE